MQAKPAPPSARPCPIAAGRARVTASPRVTSRNLATPQRSMRSWRRARSQHKMATAESAAGEEQGSRAPSSAAGKPGHERRACRLTGDPSGSGQGRFPAYRHTKPDKNHLRVAARGALLPPTNALPHARPPPVSPQATPKGRRAPAPTSINCALLDAVLRKERSPGHSRPERP